MSSSLDETTSTSRAGREALVGKTVAGRYRLLGLVGHGGMGAVYEAEHLGLGKRVAIKFVDPEFAKDEQVVARFAREARAMSAIESAHIVTVFDAGTEDGRPYLVMELLRGEDLGQRLRRLRRLPVAESMHIVAQVLKGLARAHAAGIVHRDLKPDNVFLVKHDLDPLFAKIVDFGISKIDRPRSKTSPLALTGRGTVLGTPFYMGPEQAQASSDVDARADLYSVGAILFECLSGRPPHTGESYEQVILSICMTDAPDLRAIDPNVPAEVAGFVARSLARAREQRFGSAERMLAALHEVAPAERTRVPLEAPSAKTLHSAGIESTPVPTSASKETPFGATRLGVGTLGGVPGASVRDSRSDAEPREVTPAPAPPPARGPEVSAPDRRERAVSTLSTTQIPMSKRSVGAVIATAIGATLVGVGLTFTVIAAVSKKNHASDFAAATAPTPKEAASTVAPAIPSSAAAEPVLVPTETAEPVPVAAPPASAKVAPVTAAKKPPPSPPSAKPTSKPLDIQRDLP